MQAVFHEIVLQFALSGLVAALVAIPVCAAFRRLRTQCRALNALTWTLAAPFLLVALTVGGTKTNGVNNLPQQQLMMPRPTLQTLNTLPPAGGAVNLADPVQASRAAAFAADWNVCGAWKDSFWLPFADGWVFPWGTNHLSGVEVVSHGRLWPTPFDTNAVASAGAPFEIVPDLTSFSYELTPSNTYSFAWSNAAIGRDTNDLVSAVLELFRNGDRSVTANGVMAYLPRTLPFAHEGFGQDAEWIAANFTNATEILQQGYVNWVDAQVGTGLTNGLYKLTVTVPDDPPETTQITVGDLSVAVTNAGEYVFLLEKGPAYALHFFPASTNITVSAVDDIPALRSPPRLRSEMVWGDGIWTVQAGDFECGYLPGSASAECWWLPLLVGSPDIAHIAPDSSEATFTAVVLDCAHPEDATFEWKVCDGLVAATPYAQSTVVTAEEFPSWRRVWMSVEARFGPFDWLTSSLDFTIGTNAVPQTRLSLGIPDTLFPNDDVDTYRNPAPFDVDCGTQKHQDDDLAKCSVSVEGDESLSGTLRLYRPEPNNTAYAYCGDIVGSGTDALYPESIDASRDWQIEGLYRFTAHWAMEAASTAALSYNGAFVRADWMPDEGETVSVTSRCSIARAVAEPICTSTTNVMENGVARTLVLNPCGVGVGRDAYFSIEVNPAEYPDAKITWAQGANDAGVVEFMGDNSGTGRTVRVRGVVPGEVSLEVSVGNCPSDKPTFPLYVVTNKVRHISVWIAADNEGEEQVCDESKVRDMLPTVNDVFSQIGMSFVIDSVNVLQNNKALTPYYYEESTNGIPVLKRKHLTFNELVGSVNANDIKCIFVSTFAENSKKDTLAATLKGAGIVMTSRASALTLAHELGHELGAKDIYDYKGGVDLLGEELSWGCVSDDWSNGCMNGGSGYYRRGVSCQEIILRLLMYGYSDQAALGGRDMTIGDVHGVYILQDEQCTKGNSDVGFGTIMNEGGE